MKQAITQTTVDNLYGGKLQLKQNKQGYRYGIDSILLATFALPGAQRALDLGTGVGVVALQLWYENKADLIVGLEVQSSLLRLAQANVVLNDAEARTRIVAGDLRERATLRELGEFDRVIMNPPYWPVHAGRLPPSEERAIAKHKLLGGLEEWLYCAASVLPSGGLAELVYPSERLPDLLSRALAHRLQPIALTVVHTRAKSPATLALVRCQKDARGGLVIGAPWHVLNTAGRPHSRYVALRSASGLTSWR